MKMRCLVQSTLFPRHDVLTVVPRHVFDQNEGFSIIGANFCFPHITMVLSTVLLSRGSL